MRAVCDDRRPRVVDGLALPGLAIAGLPEGCTPTRAVVIPLRASESGRLQGVLVAGVSAVLGLDEAYARQEEIGRELRRTDDAREAQLAFVEKRKPVWRGK